jgi:hypothetical protein
MPPVDLRKLAGTRYRLGHDHKPDVRATDDPWLLTIPARFGHFYAHSATHVGFATKSRGPTARALAALPYVTVLQDASDGLNLAFPVDRFDEVAQIARPHKRPVMSDAQREAAIERLMEHRFQPNAAALCPENERLAVQTPQDDPGHVQTAISGVGCVATASFPAGAAP